MNWFFTEFSHVLAELITNIMHPSPLGRSQEFEKNAISFQSRKYQNPKVKGDTTAISLTCLSKVLEDFIVSWLIDDVKEKIDFANFRVWKGHSCCLLDMLHTYHPHLDSCSMVSIRISFSDSS